MKTGRHLHVPLSDGTFVDFDIEEEVKDQPRNKAGFEGWFYFLTVAVPVMLALLNQL